jgi:anaphase-promoting complex subunit 10
MEGDTSQDDLDLDASVASADVSAASADAAAAAAAAAPSAASEAAAENRRGLREVGGEAVWSLSTAKPGNGVEQLRDNNSDTYWQSDGVQPHMINIQFHKKTTVTELWFYLNFRLDESYTPRKLSLRVGTTFHDLKEIHVLELEEPGDWVKVPIGQIFDPQHGVLRTHFIQVSIMLMHQNGRDTHVRQVKLFGPRTTARKDRELVDFQPDFNTIEFQQFSAIR